MEAGRVYEGLEQARRLDPPLGRGRFFSYLYETGDPEVSRIGEQAYAMFAHSNALDPTVFRSALLFERELVGFATRLMRGDERVVGTVTQGGTESIMVAVKAARDWWRRSSGSGGQPLLVAPITVHPSVRKAAEYLGLRLRLANVDPETKKADLDSLSGAVERGRTALVVVSAPNYPYGSVDPVRGAAEIAEDAGALLHVDACIGGFILPFLEDLGAAVGGPFDFRVEGVSMISMDLHKYGYAPKGASVILFREPGLKKHSIFVDLSWPGYTFVNTTMLSSRSVAPMAAAWAVYKYLGLEGYKMLASKVLEARDAIARGLGDLGFKPLAPLESPLLSMAHGDADTVYRFHANMSKRGWVLGLQPGVEGVAPPNLHLTVTPIHIQASGEFLFDAERAVEEPMPVELAGVRSLLERDPMRIASMLGKTPYDAVLIAWLLSAIPRDIAEELARDLVVEVYRG